MVKFFRDPLNLVCLAFLIAWGWMAVFGRPIGDYGVETDFYGDSAVQARKWMSGEIARTSFRGPAYYILIGLLGKIVGDLFLTAKLLSVVSAVAGIRIAGGVLRRLWNPTVALVAVLFIAGNPSFTAYTFRACTDTFFWLLVAVVLWLLFADPDRSRNWILAGVVAGVAYLSRYNGAGLVPGCLFAAFFLVRPLPRALRFGLLFLVPFVVVILPWCFFLWKSTGNPFWSGNYKNVAMAVFSSNASAASTGRLADAVGFTSLYEVWIVDPVRFSLTMAEHLGTHLWNAVRELVLPAWAGIAVLGFALHPRTWNRERAAFVVVGIFLYLAVVPAFFNARFQLPLLVWWGVGVGLLADFLVRRVAFGGVRWVVVGAMVAAAVVSNRAEIGESLDPGHSKSGPEDLLELVKQVKRSGARVGPETPIAAQKPHIGYYLNAPIIRIPPDCSLDDLRDLGVHYLLISGAETIQFRTLRPLQFVTDLSQVPHGLRLVAQGLSPMPEEGRYRAASLYAIENPKPWEPEESKTDLETKFTRPGFSRADHLRFELARWRYQWEPYLPIEPVLEKLSPELQHHPEVLMLRGDHAFGAKQLDAAEKFYQEAQKVGGATPEVVFRRGAVLYMQGDLAGLRRILEPWIPKEGEGNGGLPSLYNVGLRFQQTGGYIAAIAPLGLLVAENPEDSNWVQGLGVSLWQTGWLERADALFRDFLVRHPGDLAVESTLQAMGPIDGFVSEGSGR